jgi:hypothetical protein
VAKCNKNEKLNYGGKVTGRSLHLDKDIVVGLPEGKEPRGIPRRRWEKNSKMYTRETGIDGKDWTDLPQDMK